MSALPQNAALRSVYGQPVSPAAPAGTTLPIRQEGWAFWDAATGARLLTVQAREGQLVLEEAVLHRTVRFSFALRRTIQGAVSYLHVAAASFEPPVHGSNRAGEKGHPHVVVHVRGTRLSDQVEAISLPALRLLEAARIGQEQLDV